MCREPPTAVAALLSAAIRECHRVPVLLRLDIISVEVMEPYYRRNCRTVVSGSCSAWITAVSMLWYMWYLNVYRVFLLCLSMLS